MLTQTYLAWSSDQKEGTCCEFGIYDCVRMLWVHKSVICYRLPILLLDATSKSHTYFGIGKGVALRKLSSDANFTITAKVFSNDASLDDIVLADEMAPPVACMEVVPARDWMHCVIDISPKRWLDVPLMYTCTVSLQRPLLPSITVHACISKLPSGWGSRTNGTQKMGTTRGRHKPQTTDLPPAPDDLLKVVRCQCKTDCYTRRCTCKNHGLECSAACSDCKGISCNNSLTIPG